MADNLTELTPRNIAKRTHEMLMGMAKTDALTGLPNRKGWDEKVSDYLNHAKRTQESVSFVVIDLDELKKVNDTQGHEKGDDLLRDFSAVLKKVARSTDIIARYGGDEFAICLPNTDLDSALKAKERLLQEAGKIKISAGIGSTFDEADQRMYQEKAGKKQPNV